MAGYGPDDLCVNHADGYTYVPNTGRLKNIWKENEIFLAGMGSPPIFALPKTSRVRLRARTPPFHGGDTGSNPVRGTKKQEVSISRGLLFFIAYFLQRFPQTQNF